ncbi:unnamed protein product [Rhodiola kirilowii]
MKFVRIYLLYLIGVCGTASALDFFFNSLNSSSNLLLVNDAKFESTVVRLTNDSNQFSYGRAFYPNRIRMKNNSSSISSFSTSFVFSILPEIDNTPGFGLAFVLSNWTSPPNALASQYFGVFSNATIRTVAPLLAVEFDVGRNTEFNEENGNHIGVDLNYIESVVTKEAGYYDSSGSWITVNMRNGQNIQAWIDFEGAEMRINVTICPTGVARPSIPSLSYTNPEIVNYLYDTMYVGFSASKTQWVEAQRILAWSLSDIGAARAINVSGLPVFSAASASSLTTGAVAGIAVGASLFLILCLLGFYWLWRMMKLRKEDEIEDWEMEYWPHRYSYEELSQSTNKFSNDELLGFGGFGKVFKGVLRNGTVVAVKSINHDSKQGLREFMAEIGSMGRLQHKNLVQMRGWCRRGNELMLVYDYMPNSSLNRWIFDKPIQVLSWSGRRRVLSDVAEGLNYLHNGWDQVVIHRDIKSSNVLLDSDMRGRLGDFGLAKLYQHGEAPGTTRVVGTLGYLAPELAKVVSPTTASDVYSFGVVALEVACGRRPIDMAAEEEEQVLVDWVRDLYRDGTLVEAADKKMNGEYDKGEMEGVLKLGLACCHPDPSKRPTMKEVVALLVGEAAAEMGQVAVLGGIGSLPDGGELGEATLLPLGRSLSSTMPLNADFKHLQASSLTVRGGGSSRVKALNSLGLRYPSAATNKARSNTAVRVLKAAIDRFVQKSLIIRRASHGVMLINSQPDLNLSHSIKKRKSVTANAASGMAVNDECKLKFLELKAKRTHRFIVFKIDEKVQQVRVEKLGSPDETYDDFSASLPDNECRYAVYDFDFITSENCQKSKIFFRLLVA